MQVEQELAGYQQNKDSLITIGVFDGVHLGHRYLISRLKQLAKQQGFRSVVITFHKHPQEILNPATRLPFLTDAAEKSNLIKKEGVDAVIVLTFTPELARLSAREFINLLRTKLNMRGLIIGPDFAMGRNNDGNIPTLHKLGEEMGFSVTVLPPVKKDNDIISSTAIRQAMAKGEMEKVQKLLGRPFSLHGQVIHGKGRGTGLGFPTVNLNILSGQALPPDGVYATCAYADEKIFQSVTNIGKNPTFGKNERTIETFLLDYRDNLYDHEVRVDFIRKLRGEKKFENIEALKKQIIEDIEQARAILNIEAVI